MDLERAHNPKLTMAFQTDRATALKQILPVVKKEGGNLCAVARALNISVDTVRRWRQREPKLRKAIDEARIAAIKDGAP